VSESRRLRQGAGGHPGGDRRRSVLMLLTLLEVREVLQRARRAPLDEWLQRRGRLSRQGHPFEKGRCDLAPRGLLTWLLESSPGRREGRCVILAGERGRGGERGPGEKARVAYALRPAPSRAIGRWNDA
jgi:hypothetical protein